ncbi:MAG: hypothetical protein RMJ67_02420 [Elusimicrobiota bacterium]|nr:hypothetical protein [Endomicrobiia bacterium]MDW8165351.1 hypothetical protein [Elusimicrobiota bacterium]
MKKLFFFLYLSLLIKFCFCEDLIKLNCILHIHSEFSGSKYSINQIVEIAKQNKIDCVILTDHFLQKVEFGVWPFRNIIKKTYSGPSVMNLGIEKYLNEIDYINKKQQDVIVIPAVELTTHYFWSTEKDSLVINNLHKHLLIVGLSNKNYYLKMPILGNEINIKKFNLKSFWPILLVFFSLLLKSKFLFVVSLILLLSNFPFLEKKYHQYKNFDEKPYQEFINYINSLKTNSIIIWAHPEATNYEDKKILKTIKKLKIYTQTKPYYESLLKTFNYDGFSIFAEGYRKVGNIGGIWDEVLKEYCEGKRNSPIWCYSEIDFVENNFSFFIRKNIVFTKQKNKESILSSLKNGNFYAVWRDDKKELIISDLKISSQPVVFGGRYKFDKEVLTFEFNVYFSNNENKNIKVCIIKNGDLIYETKDITPKKIVFSDNKPQNLSYYRIWIESEYPHMLATNPIFVE